MNPRLLLNASIEKLEALFDSANGEVGKLTLLRDELVHRGSSRAAILLAKVNNSLKRIDATGQLNSSPSPLQAANSKVAHLRADVSKTSPSRHAGDDDTVGGTAVVSEDVEGLDASEDSSWGDYPIDTLLIRSENRTVHDILRRIEKGSFVMDPDFQRELVWKDDKQSKLLESVLMRIPLPVFYLAEDTAGRMIVVDGLQRLSSFQRFVNNDLRLKLPGQRDLHNKRFQDLSPKLQNRVEDCNLLLYVIDAKVPERARLDIFERVNGGVPLTRQQMRNCLFMGAATRFLKQEATTDLFVRATGGSLDSLKMRDREFVNRFCAFQLLMLNEYRGDMDEFLAQSLRRMNDLGSDGLNQLSAEFRRGLANNFRAFGKHAFRKHEKEQASRSVINASLWDVMSTGLSRVPEQLVEARASEVRRAFFALLSDEQFNAAISYATNDMKRVRYRFEVTSAMFKKVFGA